MSRSRSLGLSVKCSVWRGSLPGSGLTCGTWSISECPLWTRGLASLGDTLLGSGGPSFPPDPTGFGCDGFMPTTLIWHDPYFGDQSMTYNPNTGQYESDPDTFDYDSCCGCDAASNVPVQWTYSTTGVTMKYKGDGGGCPTSGSPGDNLNQNVPFNNNGISFCTTDPGEFGTNPMDPVNDDSGPGCIIYSCTPDPFGTLDTPVSPRDSPKRHFGNSTKTSLTVFASWGIVQMSGGSEDETG